MAAPVGPVIKIVWEQVVPMPDGDDITVYVEGVFSVDLTEDQRERLKKALQECVASRIVEVMN